MEYPSKFSDFPIEIIERIIDDLENDIAALKLVMHSFQSVANIFSDLSISVREVPYR